MKSVPRATSESFPSVDPEFEALIPPLTDEEFAQLEANIIAEGCREPLLLWQRSPDDLAADGLGMCKDDWCEWSYKAVPVDLWNYDDGRWVCPCGWGISPDEHVILDGHNRFRICCEHSIPFETATLEIESRDAAKDWMLRNQLGRRNLTPDNFTILLGRRYIAQKQSHGGQTRGMGQSDPSADRTSATIAAEHGVSERTVRRAAELVERLPPEKLDRVRRREITLTRAKQEVRHEHMREAQAEAHRVLPAAAHVTVAEWRTWLDDRDPCDLLLTDPPYSTDIEDIEAFASDWLPVALAKVKPTGRAYVCIGAYPRELWAYLDVARRQLPLSLTNVLVWTYRNTLGPKPSHTYKLNWQAVLYFVGPDAPPLDCPDLMEQFTVHHVSAPDGRQGDRYHTWQKPIGLAERFVRHATKPGDLVYDCFAGTGTHLLAAAKLGRVAEGCDSDPGMVAVAIDRGCHHAE